MTAIIEAIAEFIVWILADILFCGFLKIIKYTGVTLLRLLGGWKKPMAYYLNKDNFGYLPHTLGLAFISLLIFAIIKIFN